jgi:sodium transport system permease protein
MNLRPIRIVFRKELIDSLRDRRTLISMIVVPVLLMPLLLLGMGLITAKTMRKVQQEIPRVMVLGGQDSPRLTARLKALKTISVTAPSDDFTNRISDKQIQAAVDVPPGFDAALAGGEPTAVSIYIYEGEMKSMFAAEHLDQFFRTLREATIRERLTTRNLPENLIKPFNIDQKNVAPPKKVVGNLLGGLLPYTVIILCLVTTGSTSG